MRRSAPTRTAPALAVAIALLAAACGADPADEPAAEPDEPADEADDPDAAVEEPTGDDVELALGTSPLGEHLVDGQGMTLYLFTQDQPGESVCYDDCADAWPPLLVDGDVAAGDGIDGGLVGTITRADGGEQVTYADQPLYYFAADGEAGDVEGQGVNDVWFVVAPDGSAVQDGGDAADEAGDSRDTGGGYGY